VLSTHGHVSTLVGLRKETLIEHTTGNASIGDLSVVGNNIISINDAGRCWESEASLLSPLPWLRSIKGDLSILAS
jgi:hypothetical protein